MKAFCPICSGVLLRHLCQRRILWFCPGCHQEMPNFDLLKFHAVRDKFWQSDSNLQPYKDSHTKGQANKSSQTVKRDSTTIALFVNQDKKRLEVVGFILSQTNAILINTFTEIENNDLKKTYQPNILKTSKNKISVLAKANFLRDSEVILLRICQAILIADSSILINKNLSELGSRSINLKHLIEQSYFIDLIKTSVIDFIRSVSVDSSQNIYHFTSEVANYFEIVVSSIIEFQQSQESH